MPPSTRNDDAVMNEAPSLARNATAAAISRLGCAVLAMRYPVGGEFATALTERLYELLADKGQPLPRAVGMTLRELDSASLTGQAPPALSVATPTLFGNAASDLLRGRTSLSVIRSSGCQ